MKGSPSLLKKNSKFSKTSEHYLIYYGNINTSLDEMPDHLTIAKPTGTEQVHF
jgi:hypothetical protein